MEYVDYKTETEVELENEGTNEHKRPDRDEREVHGSVSATGTGVHPPRTLDASQHSISRRRRTEKAVANTAPKALIVSSKEFTADFTPPDYLIDGLAQRRFIYSLTGNTGAGKTAIALRLAAHVALGNPLGDYEVEQGRVLYFAGENPDDLRMRWIAMSEQMGFDRNDIDVHFIVGTEVEIGKVKERITAEVTAIGGVSLVIVDTSAAYFNCEECDDENDNVQARKHASMFRSLTTLPGGPTIIVLAHPPKNAKNDNLIPRGRGAFLNEVDGNFTVRKDDNFSDVHWQGKFRGPEFDPLSFELPTVGAMKLKDSKGRAIRTVIAVPLSDEDRAALQATQDQDRNSILVLMSSTPGLSLMDMARSLGWKNAKDEPDKRRIQKGVDRLKRSRLVAVDTTTKRYKLTEKGERAVAAEDVGVVADTVPASQ
jgi:hypothetical protein